MTSKIKATQYSLVLSLRKGLNKYLENHKSKENFIYTIERNPKTQINAPKFKLRFKPDSENQTIELNINQNHPKIKKASFFDQANLEI